MENTTTRDKDYITGFNDGYILSKYAPDLAEQLAKIKSDHPRMEGLRDGKAEFVNEKSHYPDWLKRDFSKGISGQENKDKNKDKELE